ncbi:MAG: Gfo/Idh/MocA family protein [Ruminiclostridium sp.]
MENVRVAMLGMGNMGRAHTNSLRKLDNVDIIALCSKPIEDARQYNQKNDTSYPVYDDFYEMLDKIKFDVLYVCLPPFCHEGQVEAAAAKGIHIFIEKPIALEVSRGISMALAVKENGVYSQVGYHMRFGGAIKKFKALLDSGSAGSPTLYAGRYECNSLHAPWWIDVNKCGGQVFEQIIHLYDMALYLMGDVDKASGFIDNLGHRDVPNYTVEDTSTAIMRFKSGALGNINGSNCSIPGQWNGFFRVICKNVVADFVSYNEAVFTYKNGEETTVEHFKSDDDATYLEDEYFMGVVRGENNEFAAIEEGLAGLKLVSAVVRSSHNGGVPVEIN